MNNNIDKIRTRVFRIWFISLFIIILVFAEKLSGIRDVNPPFSSMFQSFQIMIGLIMPQIGIMAAFYFSLEKQKDKINSLSKEQISVITIFSITYHIILITCVVAGIGFYAFDKQADGDSLARNTAAVVSIIGLFSVLLAPIAFLFAKPHTNNESQEEK